jgi:hypothetical protein
MIPNIISVFLIQKKPSMEFRRGGNDLVSKPISIPELRVERMSSMIPKYHLQLNGPLVYVGNFHKKTSTRPAGPMVRRLTTDQEIAGSNPA